MSNKAIVIKYFKEVIEEGNYEILEEIIHQNYYSNEYYGDPENFGPGITNLENRLKHWREAFEEKYLINNIMENDNAVFCDFLLTIRQKNAWIYHKPTGKTARIEGFVLFYIKEGKISSIKLKMDYDDMWAQLGHLVDAADYSFPGDLPNEKFTDRLKLKQDKVKELENDFQLLHSSAVQYKDLLQYANYIRKFLDISDKAMRTICFQSVAEWQQEFSLHQSDLTGHLPQELLMQTLWILERGKQKVVDLLMNKKDITKIDLLFDYLIDFFTKEYSK